MDRIEWEKQTVRKMIALYCRHHLKQDTQPKDYELLAEYACQRLEHCRFREDKKSCDRCSVHCYSPQKRQQIKEVMRWVGPRMMFYCPKDAMLHMWHSLKVRFHS